MPICPKCHYEFFRWVKKCPYCDVDLVGKLETGDKLLGIPDENLVVAATFSHPETARLYSAKLESEGIDSFVGNEHIVTTNWLYSTAVGGVKLFVRESDLVAAKKLIVTNENNDGHPVSSPETCPSCKSTDVYYERFALRPMYVIWLITSLLMGGENGTMVPIFKRKWRCKNCNNQWK